MQGGSHVDESISSHKTSSSVHAKEALIEIDYSNLHEDLKVFHKLTHAKTKIHPNMIFMKNTAF